MLQSLHPFVCGYITKQLFQIKQIFNKYGFEVSRFQYTNYLPVSTQKLNDENKETVFKLDIEDDFISKKIEYYIEGNVAPVDATKLTTTKAILN